MALRITSDEPLFQPAPFAALLDRYDDYRTLAVSSVGPLAWETEPLDPADAAHVAVAATDTSGNHTTRHVRYLPDDLYIDNSDAAYVEPAGSWSSDVGGNDAQVWGPDYRRALVQGDDEARARWTFAMPEAATYNVFVRVPDDDVDAAPLRVRLFVNGATRAEYAFHATLIPAEWTYAGTVSVESDDEVAIEMMSTGQGVLAADAVKLSAKIHERRLQISPRMLDFGEVIVADTTTAGLPVRNTGTGTITITRLYSESGVVSSDDQLPIELGPMESRSLALQIHDRQQGEIVDTLYVDSDDSVEPVKAIPFNVRVIGYFTTVDDGDPGAYEETGAWQTSVTEAYGHRSRYASADAGAEASFIGSVDRGGTYAWSYLVPRTENAAVRAQYVLSAGGEVVDTIVVDQNAGSGSWRALGLHALGAGETFRIAVRWADVNQDNRVLRADAVRLFRVGGELDELVVDNDEGEYSESGSWSTSVSADSYGPSSRWTPADGSGRATYRATVARSGMHGIYQIVPSTVNAAERAVYRISRNGLPVDSVVVTAGASSLPAWLLSQKCSVMQLATPVFSTDARLGASSTSRRSVSALHG